MPGVGINFLRLDGQDIFLRDATDALSVGEINPTGTITGLETLTIAGQNFELAAAATVLGTAVNFFGSGGADLVVRGDDNGLIVSEFNSAGTVDASHELSISGQALFTDGNSLVEGSGLNFLGTSHRDVFLFSGEGLAVYEVDQSGTVTAGATLSYEFVYNDVPYYTSTLSWQEDEKVIGAGLNFLGDAGHDVFARSTNNSVSYAEFVSSDIELGGSYGLQSLSVAGSLFLLDVASTVVGTGFNFLGTGNHDLFVRTATGQLDAWEFNSTNAATAGRQLTVGGSAFVIDGATAVVGTGFDLWGSSNADLFVSDAANQLSVWEFTTAGAATSGHQLSVAGSPLVWDIGNTILGTGYNFFGAFGEDLFLRTNANQVDAWEFDASGAAIYARTLIVNGVPLQLDAGSLLLGNGSNFWGTGGSDLVFENGAGAAAVWEFNSSGVATTGHLLTSGGTSYALGSGSTVIGTSAGILVSGDSDLYVRSQSGAVSLVEFDSAGSLTDQLRLSLSAAALSVAATSVLVGAGVDQTSGALDIILKAASGQTSVYDLLGATLSTVNTSVTTTQPDGTDIIVGTAGNDTLTASTGTAKLIGNGGSDTYYIGANVSQVTIINGLSGGSTSGTLTFLSSGIGINNLWFDRVDNTGAIDSSGDNLRIDVLGTNQSVVVENWFASFGTMQALADIVVGGSGLKLDSNVTTLMTAMSDYEATHGGDTFNPAAASSTISDVTVLAAVNSAWHM